MQVKFYHHIKERYPQLLTGKFLMTVSGGCDSVVLTHLLHASKVNFEIAHCNFNLRGDESDNDQQFVENLAAQLGYPCHTIQFNTKEHVSQYKVSTQMAARELRYQWFHQLLDRHSLDAIITAHHLDDQIETFLINLDRGTGLKGLTGMEASRHNVVRPLLPYSRKEIEEYAVVNDIQWREDSSNRSNDYLRNNLRNQVLPTVFEALPNLKDHFAKTLRYLNEASSIVDDAVARFRESVTTTTPTTTAIDINKLKKVEGYQRYLFYLLEPYGFKEVDEIDSLINSQTGKFLRSQTHILLKDRQELRLKALGNQEESIGIIEKDTVQLNVAGLKMRIQCYQPTRPMEFLQSNHSKNVLMLDTAQLEYPLTLRPWQTGDRLQPYGLEGSQLVSDILINNKVSLLDKERTYVLENNSGLLWVIGYRTSKHYPITGNTKEILKITWDI